MKKIKVLHICEALGGGIYTYIKDICAHFEALPDFESTLIYSSNRDEIVTEKFDEDFGPNTTLIELPMTREISLVHDSKAVRQLAKAIREIRPDVIHLHSSKAGILGKIAAKLAPGAAVYYTPNGYAFLRLDIPLWKRRMYRSIEWISGRILGGTTIACGDTEYEYATSFGKAKLVRNGIDVPAVAALARPKAPGPLVIGTVGRLSPQKNPRLFDAIARLLPDISFVWVGGGELIGDLQAPNIEIVGWIPREEVMERLNTFDIYLQTSLWEGLPFAIIEAMSVGKPVVATDVIGNKDAVEDGYNGYLCMEPETFAARLKTLAENEALRKEMGQKSTQRAHERFDRNQNFKKLEEIYASGN